MMTRKLLTVWIVLVALGGAAFPQGGMGPGPGTVHSAAAGCSEATTFLARTSGLDATHVTAYTNLICGMVTNGIWANTEGLYVTATQDNTTARLNIKSTSYSPLGNSGSAPTFTADRGYQSASAGALDPAFNPFTSGSALFTQNSAHEMVWSNTTGNSTAGEIGVSGTTNTFWITNSAVTGSQSAVNRTGSKTENTSSGKGFYLSSRTGSTNTDNYWGFGGSLTTLAADATASGALANVGLLIGGVGGFGYGNKQISAASWGAALNSTQATSYYTLMQAFMTAVGN